jgi:hypothetical protein
MAPTGWETCTPEFERLAAQVGGIDCAGHPVVTFSSPFSLDNGTMPVVELVLIVGAAAGLVHALRWRRSTGDASNLVVWWAGIVALLIIEPLAYFPQWFGAEEFVGLAFVHNQFSVQFLHNRLPLYIVAMYPAFMYMAWVLVQRTGVAARRGGTLLAATCVAFTFHCFYEVIDHVGPQLGWWVWNPGAPAGRPTLGVVPYANLQAFGIGIPFGIALVARTYAEHGYPWFDLYDEQLGDLDPEPVGLHAEAAGARGPRA